jgi:hypothetical protein
MHSDTTANPQFPSAPPRYLVFSYAYYYLGFLCPGTLVGLPCAFRA